MVGGNTSAGRVEGQKTLYLTQPAGRRVCVSTFSQSNIASKGHHCQPSQFVSARVQWPSCAIYVVTVPQLMWACEPDFSETGRNQSRVRNADAGQRAATAARRISPHQRGGRGLHYAVDMMEHQSRVHVTRAGPPTAGYQVGPVPAPAGHCSSSATVSASQTSNSAGHQLSLRSGHPYLPLDHHSGQPPIPLSNCSGRPPSIFGHCPILL